MKRELAERWAAALRSGKYKQGKNALRTGKDTYCCLGVLCDIQGIEIPHGAGTLGAFENCAGLKSLVGKLPTEQRYQDLAMLNDNGVTFRDIANLIEKYWSDL